MIHFTPEGTAPEPLRSPFPTDGPSLSRLGVFDLGIGQRHWGMAFCGCEIYPGLYPNSEWNALVPRGTGWYFGLPEIKDLAEIWNVVGRGETREWWPGTGLNRRRRPFQGRALPLSYLALAWSA